MGKKNIFVVILASLGAGLVWLSILAPLVLGFIYMSQSGRFVFDFLLPAEVFPLPLAGGLLLLAAALWVRARRGLIGWGLLACVAFLLVSMVLSEITGLASGETELASWRGALVLIVFGLFWAALLSVAVGGALLLRDRLRGDKPRIESP